MITIVYLENPFKPQNRVIRQISAAEAPAVIDVAALLNANLSGEMILSVNGQKVAADHLLKDGDFVVITPNVLGGGGSGKNIAGIVAGIALMAFSGGAGAGLLGILGTTQGSLGLGLALYSGGSLLMGNQRLPKIDTPNVQSSFENGYGWSPDQVRLQPGSPLPITYGTFKTSGQLIARRVYPGNFAGKQTQYLSMLLAAGEGPLDSITDIEINDTPVASIQGATSDYRLGTNNQTEIPGISNIIEDQVFSSELPLSGSAWITKTQPEPGDRVTHTFVFPAGLYAVDTRSGATIPCRGAIRWQYREVGASSWIPLLSHYYWGQARRPFYFILDFSPPDKTKTYEFRAQNYTLERYREIEGGDWVGLTEMPGNYSAAINWIGLTVKSWKNQAYPGTALVYINLPATENLSGSMPRVSWKQIRATVNVWNPTEEKYQAKDATNFAWMVYDLLHQCKLLKNIQTGLDEYVVFGEPKENLNYTEFEAWASFCAETAGGAPRGKGNALIDSPEQIWPIVQKVAASGRGFIVQQAGVFKPVWDSTRTMSQIFTAGNIVDGSLSGSFLPERERASALEVSFFDEDNGYERTTLFVPGDDYNPAGLENPSQIFLPCITSSKVAYMWAKHQLKKNKYLKRTATLQADIDSIVAELGDVIGIQSDVTSWGVGGRILGATTTSVVIDQAVTLSPGNTYSLLIRYPDNTLVRRVVDAVLVSTTTTTLNFTGAPWPTAPGRFCVYSFGINTLETKPFQITDIRRNGDLQASLELLEYIEDVHTEATDFPVIDYTAASAGISSLTVKADSDTGKLGIAWTIPTDRDYAGSVVYVDGKPQGFFPTDVTDLDIDATPGSHTVTVRPVNGSGNYGTEVEEEITLGNPTLAAISDLSLSSTIRGQADGTNLVYITGTFTIPDLASSVLVEIGEGSNPVSWATVQDSRVAAVQYGPVSPGTLYTLRFTAKNRYAVSDPVLEAVTTTGDTTAPNAPTVSASGYLKVIKVEIALENPPSDLAGFEIWKNTENNANAASLAGYVAAVNGAAFFIDQAPSYLSEMYYWAKSVDAWGNKSPFSASSLPTHVSQILSGDITANQIIGKHFTTAQDVGATVDGVKFTADGIEMWEDGVRKVLIPVTGDPEFYGLLTAAAGHIGGWEIFPTYLQSSNIKLDSAGLLQTLDFVSGYKGWKINQDGNAEFNNLRARGAIKTVVFEKDEISAVGGRTLIRPAGVVKDYDYTEFINAAANVYLEECWDKLNELLGASDTYVASVFADYDEYVAAELAYYNELCVAMGFNQFTCAIIEADYDDATKDAYLTACWAQLMTLLDLTTATPAIPSMTFAAYKTLENGYFDEVAEAIDNPPLFEPFINDSDTAIETENTDQFKVGDIIRVKDGLTNDYWGRVSAIAGDMLSITGEYGEPFAITAGQTIVNYGIPGSGGILLDGQAPLMDVYTHSGKPWLGSDIKLRIGNLNGWGTINDNIYGIAIGQPDGEYLVYDSTSGRLRMNGSIEITEGSGYANLTDKPTSLADINSTEGNKLTAVDNWAVAGTNYTQIQGGVITTGQIKSGDYVAPAVGESFAQAGSSYDLDNASITTENFYSNENGAGIKGHIETDSGNIGDWIIGRGLTYDNTVGLDRTILTLGGAGESLYLSRNYASQAQDTVNITPAFSTFFYSDVNSPNISETDAATYRVTLTTTYLRMQSAILNNESYKSELSASRLEIFSPDNSQCSLNSKTLTLAGNTSATVTIGSDNPKIVFKNANGTQQAALVFTDYDSYAAPASVSLVGNQGNEVFIAPRFRTATPTGPASVLLSGGINSYGESAIFGISQSGASPMIGYGVKPHPSTHGAFVSSYGANLGRIALLLDGNGLRVFTGGTVNVPVGNAVSMTERFKLDHSGNLTLNGYAIAVVLETSSTHIVWAIGSLKYLEKWGSVTVSSANYTATISIGKTMTTTDYSVQLTPGRSSASFTWVTVTDKTTTSFQITSNSYNGRNYATEYHWRIIGRVN